MQQENRMTEGITKKQEEEYTLDGSVDRDGCPGMIRRRSGGWRAGFLLLVNQGLASLAFTGVEVNLVLFLTRVLKQNNAKAANNVSKWTGTLEMCSLVGAFLSDSYWGRYKTCAIFQFIFFLGLVLLSLSSYLFLLKPSGCGDRQSLCGHHSKLETSAFYLSIYLIALGKGGYQPSIATFGADQFDEEDPKEGDSKDTFYSYFFLALNLGGLFPNTIFGYLENEGCWALCFWMSTGFAFMALVLFLCGTTRYRQFKPGGNPIIRVCQVVIAAMKKWMVEMPPQDNDLYEVNGKECAVNGGRNILHTQEFKFLDKAALITSKDYNQDQALPHNPWSLCTITQVEEVKCMLRLLPIWLSTILYSSVFTQMASLFIVQGAVMKTTISNFHIPPASMSSFNIISVAIFIFLYQKILNPIVCRLRRDGMGLTELQKMGVGLVIAVMAMVSAGIVESYRLEYSKEDCNDCHNASSLSIVWQIPQYVLIGASEVFMYVGQLAFFNGQAPYGFKSFGSALCMTSVSLGNYVSSLLVAIVMKITTKDNKPGWIPGNLNMGHVDTFYFLLAALTTADFVVYLVCATRYRGIKIEGKYSNHNGSEEVSKDLRVGLAQT